MDARDDLNQEETLWQGASGQQEARQASTLLEKPMLAGYELSYLLGRGSFGEVWAARQNSTGQSVAIKFFLAGDLSYIRRELERLREVSQHSAVVGLVDADLDHQPPYFVMPLLARSLDEEDMPTPSQAAGWMEQLAQGLRHSHEKGLLHCDLKPSNVMLDETGSARLVDFGQSRQHGDGVVAWGTLGFMAPEQAALGDENAHSSPTVAWDVYGLGATLYRLLTGFCPYWSESELKSLKSLPLATRLRRYRQQIEIAPLIPVRKVNAKVDADLADLIQACLACDPARRPPGMAAILDDLDRRRRGEPLLCRRPWSWAYLVSKWARRPALVAASLATAALVTTAAHSYLQMRRANLEQQSMIQALIAQQAAQAESAGRPEEAQLWRCRALQNQPDDAVLRTQLGREHYGLQAFSAQSGGWSGVPGRPELIECTDSEVLIWKEGRARKLDLHLKPLKVVGSGRWLAVLGTERGLIYDLQAGRILASFALGEPAQDAAWDGEVLVLLGDKGVTRWSQQGKLLARLDRAGRVLSPDGRWLYGDGQVTQLEGGRLRKVPGEAADPEAELFSPGGSWIQAGDRLLSLRGAADWPLEGKFACFLDDRRVATINGSRVSICAQGEAPVELQEPVEALEVKAGGDFLLVAGAGDEFSLWDARNGARLTSKSLHRAGRGLRQLLFNGDASLLLGDDTLSSRIWRLDPPRPRWTQSTPGRVVATAWGENQSWLWAGARDGLVRFSLEGQKLDQFLWPQPALSYAFSSGGLGVAELDGSLRLFWPGHQEVLAEYPAGGFEESFQRLFFNRTEDRLLACLPGQLKLWQVEGQHLKQLRQVAIAEPPQQLAVSPSGQYVAALCGKLGSEKLKLSVWRLPELRGVPLEVSEISFEGQPLQLVFDPGEDWLLVGCGGRQSTFSLGQHKQLSHWQAALDPDAPWMLGAGWLLECNSDYSLQKVSLPTGKLLGAPWAQPIQVTSLAARGDLGLVSNLYDTRLLDLRDGQSLSPGLGAGGFSHLLPGHAALLGSREDQIGLWPLESTTASPETVMRRWQSLTGKRLDRERATVVDLQPEQWTPP